MRLAINIITMVIIFASIFVYYRQVKHVKRKEYGYKVLANTSQLTMSAFILGLGVLLTELNAFGLSRREFTNHLLIFGAFVSLITIFGIWYYNQSLKDN